MDETNLIVKLKELKNIAPNKEWAVLAKIKMFEENIPVSIVPTRIGLWQTIPSMFFQKKFAYAFVALAILVIGSVGVMQLPVNSGTPQVSPAALVEAKNSVEAFKVKSKELAIAATKDPQEFSLAVNEIKAAAKQLTETIQKDPGVAKEIALEINNNKTYLNVEGSAEFKSTLDDMYRNTVKPLIEDFEERIDDFTKSQREAVAIARDLYEKKRYTDALESSLLLSMAMQNQ